MKQILVIILMALSPLTKAEIYRWVDENGVTNFSNERPDSTEEIQSRQPLFNTFVSPTISVRAQPLDLNREVVMYSTERCKSCDGARKYFQENGIAFLEYDVEKSEAGRQAFESLGGEGVPLIMVGGERLNGFSIKSFNGLYE